MQIAINEFNRLHDIKDSTNKANGVIEETELLYYFDYNKQKYTPAYRIQITSKNTQYSENVFISLINDKFLGAENLICTINFPGTAETQYNGARNIVTDAPSAAGPFRLQETRNNVLIRTRNINNRPDLSSVTDFTDNNNNWTDVEHGTNRAAFDAHWGAETVYDYWLNVHNRNSINGSGMPIESYVHWDVPGDNDDFNARWFQNSMWYGDGFGSNNPLTALDICAHEIGHGIDHFTGNLAYERESGALDEGFADIWGASVEAWATPNKQRWLLGEDILGGPIRNMANPNANSQPDTYLGTFWVNTVGCTPSNNNDFCGVHTNSGVINFWYFLISEGGAGTNDLGNAYNVNGLGINAAARIAYRTKLLMNNSLADYPLTRAMSIQAAQQLFGVNSCEEIVVTNAWFAVGVGARYFGNAGYSINGDDLFCTTSNNYGITSLPAGAVVQWEASPAGIVNINMPNSPQTTLTRVSSGSITLTAIITNVCGGPISISKQNIVIGAPYYIPTGTYSKDGGSQQNLYTNPANYGTVVYYNNICSQATTNMSVPPSYNIRWSFVSASTSSYVYWYQTGNNLYVMPNYNQSVIFQAQYINACGNGHAGYVGFKSGYCSGGGGGYYYRYSISPNPVTTNVKIKGIENTVSAKDAFSSKQTLGSITEINIYDQLGNLKKNKKFGKISEATIDVSDLKTGVYFVEIVNGAYKERQPLNIKR